MIAAADHTREWLTFGGVVVSGLFGVVGIVLTGWWSWKAQTRGKQLEPNGGSSLADSIRRIEAQMDRQAEASTRIESRVERIDATTSAHGETLRRLDKRTDEHGRIIGTLGERLARVEGP